MSDQIIYERLDARLPEWARWIAKDYDGYIYLGAREPTVHMKYWTSIEGKETRISPHDTYYAIPGPWHKSLRRIIRIDEPEWYSPDNDQCDEEGFLAHDGGPMPEWARGKMVQTKDSRGNILGPFESEEHSKWITVYSWKNRFNDSQIIAYRIVGDDSEDQIRLLAQRRNSMNARTAQFIERNERNKEVNDATERLESNIAELYEYLSDLTERLNPVLCRPDESPESISGSIPVYSTPLANQIRHMAEKIGQMSEQVDDALSRLEV